jgi:hypothetical protein
VTLNRRHDRRTGRAGRTGSWLRAGVLRARLVGLVAVALLSAACGGATTDDAVPRDGTQAAGTAQGDELAVAVASFDLAVGEDRRLLAGLFTTERELLAFGEVTYQLGYLGQEAGGSTELTQEATASFVPVPGNAPDGDPTGPRLLGDTTGSGLYAAEVDLDTAGFWGLRVVAELVDGRVLEGRTTFQVASEPQVPAVGEPAPRTRNATLADVEAGRVEPVALDSRAQGADASVPDQHLHATTVEASLQAGRPVVVIVATPVYCVSQFCGPLVETLSATAQRYADRADFVHLEVWEDFEAQRLNDAAAEWIQTSSGGNEPWVFLVDGQGRIAARWDNVLDLAALEAALASLPSIEVHGDA